MDSAIKRAEVKLEHLSSDRKTIELYNARQDSLHERANMISSAKAEGKMEERIEVAKKLLSLNISISVVSESTRLTSEQIEEIKKSMKN
ncbi:MAG TPA: hypothetical protein VF941_10635 [Clostridia bacterium]